MVQWVVGSILHGGPSDPRLTIVCAILSRIVHKKELPANRKE